MSARRYLIPIVVIGAQMGLVTAAHAQSAAEVEEAKKHYARGVQLYNQKADAAALAELERAYALAPNWKILYNLGLVELQMNDFASALRSFEKYRVDGGANLGAVREREVAGRIAALRDQVATIDVNVNTPDADVTLDDIVVGRSPLATALIVNPGHHKLGASKAGRSAEIRSVSVAGADHTIVELAIAIAETPAPQAPASSLPIESAKGAEATLVPVTPVAIDARPLPIATPVDASPEHRDSTAPPDSMAAGHSTAIVIAWSATGALAAGAVVTGLIALSANSDLTNTKAERATSIDELNHLASRAHGFAVASDVFTIGAIAGAGASLYLTLHTPKATAAKAGTAPASIDVSFGAASVRVLGTF